MSDTIKTATLGQIAFVLSPDGAVVRTMVARIDKDNYQFLNGDDSRRPHWFNVYDAVAAAGARIRDRQTALRKELRTLAQKRRALETQEYRIEVMSAPYRAVDLRDTMILYHARPRRPRKLKKVLVPKTYHRPGQVVYAIITPATRSEMETYRPHGHFVLETEVRSVCFSPDGQAHYTFSTPLLPEEFFPLREEATARLQSFSEPGTKEPVPFVSSQKEKEELEKLVEDIPF